MIDPLFQKLRFRCRTKWESYWMRRSGLHTSGRAAMNLAAIFSPRYKDRCYLSQKGPIGYIAPTAIIQHKHFTSTRGVYIGDRTTIYRSSEGGSVCLNKGVHLYSDIIIETGQGGGIFIDEGTHMQPRCSISAYKGSVKIGKRAEIAPNCAFYPYNHQINPGGSIRDQPLISKGDIVMEDDVWLGFGSIILENVRIGSGAVIGAGSIVTKSIPSESIAVGSPARIVGRRDRTKL